MAAARGSAIVATMLLLCTVLLHCEIARAATYMVGDDVGWNFREDDSLNDWPKGKKFVAGDVLVFNYNPVSHNVVVVNKEGYDTCKAPVGAKVYTSGKDKIELVKGDNFFLCGFRKHCGLFGMKIAVTAL